MKIERKKAREETGRTIEEKGIASTGVVTIVKKRRVESIYGDESVLALICQFDPYCPVHYPASV